MSSIPPLLGSLHEQMKHLAERQRVIAQNIANSETPGFKAQELEAPDFASLVEVQGKPHVARPRVQVTSGMVALGVAPTTQGRIVADGQVSETKPDGNNVTLEDQLLKMSEIRTDFATMTNLYRKNLALIQTAIGRAG